MNLPKEKESSILSRAQSEFRVNVTDSSFEFVLYKSNNFPSVIKCLLLLIVNDMEIADGKEDTKQEKENEKNISDINNEYKLLERLKKFIFNYIKINRKNKNIKNNDNTNIIETILLAEAKDVIRFFNLENNGINLEDENIKKISEIIKSIASKLEIKQKKNEEKEKQEKENVEMKEKNDINEVLDELNPDYKNELIYRYLDEMPEELANLMKKYRKINFTKSMYMNYLENKNKNFPGETPLDKMNIEN
jgi:hypothetical protein